MEEPLDSIVFRPREWRPGGRILATIRERQTALVEELRTLDAEVEVLVTRRAEIVGQLRRCRDAVGGIGIRWIPREPLPGEVDAEPTQTRIVPGSDLREALRAVLLAAARPLTIAELHRGLLARGMRPEAPASKRISDALRWEVRHGAVERLGRGRYGVAREYPRPMAELTHASLRAQLHDERDRLADQLRQLGRGPGADLDFDDGFADTGQVTAERGEVDALVGSLEETLLDIDDALVKFDAGTYGTCEDCGAAIGEARLEAMPAARFCMNCASTRR